MEKNLSDKKFDILHENISMVKFYKKIFQIELIIWL